MAEVNGVAYGAATPPGVVHDPDQAFQANVLVGITGVFLPIAAALTGIRLYTRACIVAKLSIDDYLMMGAMALSIVMSTFNLNMLNYGLGKDLWNVPVVPDLYPNFNFNNLMAAIFFCAATGFAKGSILLFYLRIFPTRSLHVATWIVFCFTACYSLASVFVNVFSCNPVKASWVFELAATAKCINRPSFYFAQAALGIVTDIATVVLPIPVLRTLRLPRKQKIAVALTLSMGAFVCVVSIVRLHSLNVLLTNTNLTHNTVVALTWCVLELNLSIIGGCIPTVKPFVQRLCPRLLDTTRRGGTSGVSGGNVKLSNMSGSNKRSTMGSSHLSGLRSSQANGPVPGWGGQFQTKGSAAKSQIQSTVTGSQESGSEEYIMIDNQAITKTVEYGFYKDEREQKQNV